MTVYPGKVDSDAELPRVDDNISELSVETINALREAVIAIEKTIGVNPQGSTATLVQRLSVFFNDDGTAKASALVAAGLVALPITNAMISSNAAIEESKLDLDIATQTLQDQISSNDIDITSLQNAIVNILADYANHVNGISQKHDGYAILLDKLYPTSTPPWLTGITATNVSAALAAMNTRFLNHTSASAVGSHPASAISVDNFGLQTVTASNVQEAIRQLDESRAVELVDHRDDMHSNGISLWANSTDGYSEHNQIIPQTVGDTVSAYILPTATNIIDFSPLILSAFPLQQGDSVAIFDTAAIGSYIINDIGPRNSVGTKPSLTANQLEIVGSFPLDGYVTTRVYGSSSTILLKGSLATTVHQSDTKVDSLQVSRPNAARVVSLGAKPQFLDATSTLIIEVGVSTSAYRTIAITDLHKDRNGVVTTPPTLDTLIERINSVLQNRVDGNAFPVAAYRIGDEFMLSHNWTDDFAYIRVLSTGTANFYLGFDSAGANIEDRYVYPTANAYFYVNGIKLNDVAVIASRTASISGQYFSFTGFDPIAAGIKIGHLLHLKSHANSSEIGTYFITEVTTSTIKIHKNAGITTQTSVDVEIVHDALPLDDFNTNVKDLIIEAFVTSSGTLGYNERLSYEDNISNFKIIDVSDNFVASSYTLESSIASGVASIRFNSTYEKTVRVTTAFTGNIKIPTPNMIESVTASITAPIGVGTSQVTIYPHINEEEVLELCSVRLDGLLTLSHIVDKRMFGTLGLDELREDVVQAYIETPNKELRSNGIISGFDVLAPNVDEAIPPYEDPTFPLSANLFGLLIRGGTAMVDGVRVSVPTTSVMFPNVAGTFIVGINKLGTFGIFDTADYSMASLLDGYAGEIALIAQVDHDGVTIDDTSVIDLRFNISKIDDRVELLVDESNHFIGHFSSFKSALQYINNYPSKEKFKVRVVSYGGDLEIPAVSHSLSVVIDGQVNNVTIDGPVKIMAESVSDRVAPHILGGITVNSGCNVLEVSNVLISGSSQSTIDIGTSGSSYKFNNVVFDGYQSTGQLSISGTDVADVISFYSCDFIGGPAIQLVGASIIVDNLILSNCRIEGIGSDSKVNLHGNNVIVTDTMFDNCGFDNTVLSNSLIIDNCTFRNFTALSGGIRAINSVSTAVFSSCKFEGIAASTASPISCSVALDANTRLYFGNCVFDGCTATVSSPLIQSRGTVSDCVFKDTICPVAPGGLTVECSDFVGNVILNSTNEFMVGAGNIGNNSGIVAARSASFAAIKSVFSNTFIASSVIGYNIRIASTSGVHIYENIFSAGAQVAIQVDSGDGDLVVNGNEFDQTGYCINTSVASLALSFTGNVVRSTLIMQGPGSGNMEAVFSSNVFEHASGFTINGTMSRATIENNLFLLGALEISTTTVSALNVVNNFFATDLIISADLYRSNISNNIFNNSTLEIGGSIYSSTIVGNINGGTAKDVLDLDVSTGTISDSKISGNTIDLSGIGNAILENTIISGNIIGGVTMDLTIVPSAGASHYANVVFSDNIFLDAASIGLICSGTIRGVSIQDNVGSAATHPTYGKIVTFSVINECTISGNINFGFETNSGMNSCVVNNNIALNADMLILGACNSNLISGNYINDFEFNGSSASGLLFTNMFINGTASIIADGADIERLTFANNVITGDLTLTSSGGNLNNSILNGNTCNDLECNVSGSDLGVVGNFVLSDLIIWSAADSYSLARINISNNTVSSNALICNLVDSETVQFTDSKISGNIIGADLQLLVSTSSATVTFTGNAISDNFCTGNLYFFNTSTRGDITFRNNSILNNRIGGDIEFRTSIVVDDTLIEKTIISNNSCDSFILGSAMTYDGLSLVSNRFDNSTTSIQFALDPQEVTNTFSKLNISNNILAGNAIFTVKSANCELLDNFIFSNNIMLEKEFRLAYDSASALSFNAQGWVFTNNNLRAISIRSDGGSNAGNALTIRTCNFSNNSFAGLTAAGAGLPYEPGIFVSKGSKTGALRLSSVAMRGNFYGGDTGSIPRTEIKLLTASSLVTDINNCIFSDNVNVDIYFTASSTGAYSLNETTVSSNVFFNDEGALQSGVFFSATATTGGITACTFNNNIGGAISFSKNSTFSNNSLSHNNVKSISLSSLLSAEVSIQNLVMANNIVDSELFLPTLVTFSSGATASKFLGNHAYTWTCSSAFTTAGSNRVFVWGNTTQTATTNVTFSGTTATDTQTANSVTTGAPTGITN